MGVSKDYTALVQVKISDVSLRAQLNNIKIKPLTLKVRVEAKDAVSQLNTIANNSARLGKQAIKTSTQMQSLNRSLTTTSNHVRTLGNDFLVTLGKVGKFGAITSILGLFTGTISKAANAVKNFDSTLTEFKKVSNLDGESLKRYTENLSELGITVGRTKTEMLDSSTMFVKTGSTEKEAAQLALVAELYKNIADSEVNSADASAFLISQIKSFNITTSDSIRIIDAVNAVANKFAVGTNDLQIALEKTGSALGTLGNSYEQTLALVTSGTSIMQGQASKVGKGLRTIGINLNDMAQKTDYLTDSSGKVKVAFKDENNELKNTYNLMTDLFPQWGKLNNEQKTNLATTIAGKQQFEVFTAVMNNFSDAQSSYHVALKSSGSAMEENEKKTESLEYKTNLLKAEFEEFVLGDGGLSNLTKGFTDAGTAILRFANNDVGKTVVSLTSIMALSALTTKTFKLLSVSIIKLGTNAFFAQHGLTALTAAQMGATAGTVSFGTAIKALTVAWLSSPFVIVTAIIASISAVTTIISKLNSAFDDSVDKINSVKNEYNELATSIETIEDKLKTLSKKIKDIKSGKIELVTNETLNKLEQQEKSLKQQLLIQEALVASKKKEVEQESLKTLKTPVVSEIGVNAFQTKYVMPQEELQKAISEYEKLENRQESLLAQKAKLVEQGRIESVSYEQISKSLEKTEKEMKNVKRRGIELSDSLQIVRDSLFSDNTEKKKDGITKLVDAFLSIIEVEENYKDSTDEIADAEEKAIIGSELFKESLASLELELSILSGVTLTGLSDAFDLVNKAQQEMSDSGILSAETFQSLMGLGNEYIAILFNETGALDTSTNAQMALYKAKIEEMGITAARGQINLASSLAEEGKSYYALANATQMATNSKWNEINALAVASGVEGKDLVALQNRINGIQRWTENAKKSVTVSSNYSTETKNSTRSTKSNTSATKENTNALKEQKKGLDDLIDKYKSAINYIKNKLDEEVNALEDTKNKELKTIDEKISALNKQKDFEEKYYDEKIETLKKTNDEIENNINLEELQTNLAIAKSKVIKLYKDGKFVYSEDTELVNEAQKNLSEYTRKQNYEKQLQELEDLKNGISKNLDEQIQNWEEHKNNVEKNYDAQIESLNKYKDSFEQMVTSYQTSQDKLNAEQLSGIDFEKGNWETRLTNLQNFINKYNELLTTQKSLSAQIDETPSNNNTNNNNSNGNNNNNNESAPNFVDTSSTLPNVEEQKKKYYIAKYLGSYKTKTEADYNSRILKGNGSYKLENGKYVAYKKLSGGYLTEEEAKMKTLAYHGDGVVNVYNKGTPSITEDQIGLVGDKESSELVVGSKLNNNNGSFMNLKKGTGIIPHNLTMSLIDLVKQSKNIDIPSKKVIESSESTIMQISNVSVSANNADEFIESMKQFKLNIKQETYNRK